MTSTESINRLLEFKQEMDKQEQNVEGAYDDLQTAKGELERSKQELAMAEKRLAEKQEQFAMAQNKLEMARGQYNSARAAFYDFQAENAAKLALIDDIVKKRKIEKIARILANRHNMNKKGGEESISTTIKTTTEAEFLKKAQFVVLPMPLELHCEWFACLPLFFQRWLIPELCRGIYAIKGKEVKRKLELLNKWQHWDKKYLILTADRRSVKYIQKESHPETADDWATVRAARPFCFESSSQCQMRGRRIWYFEVKIVVMNIYIGIGLCDGNFPLSGECVGGKANSFGMISYGKVWMEDEMVKSNSDLKFDEGDVIGCGLKIGAVDDGQKMHLFFTKNGTICGIPFQLPASTNGLELFPAVSLFHKSDQIEANFGGNVPFVYDLAKHTI